MPYAYSSDERENDPRALPDIMLQQFTAEEVAEMLEDTIWEYSRRHEFRLAPMNGRVRDAMIARMIEEEGITGGWMWAFGFPGCLPDSEWFGPFPTIQEAKAEAIANAIAERAWPSVWRLGRH